MTRMDYSDFGRKLTGNSGILLLMDDLGRPLPEGVKPYPLGGGNPARVPAVEAAWRREMEKILSEDSFEDLISHYDAPQGRMEFISQCAAFFRGKYGWDISEKNIAITNGSQSAMFYLFNLFSGKTGNARKTILFPLMPEYVGYADQGIEPGVFVSVPSKMSAIAPDHSFKYSLDLPAVEAYLEAHPEVGAICVSRPTNPSGNVLTDSEIKGLSGLSKKHGVPLIVDNAYGLPFPSIVFTDDATPLWEENIILSMSLSKIGLPSIRTGIIVAREEIVTAISNMNAIIALASGSFGQALAGGLIESGDLAQLAKTEVRPYYQEKALATERWIHEFFDGTDYAYHRIEGSIFCWLVLPKLRIPSAEFYRILKERGVITVPGEYFFYGSGEQAKGLPYPHPHYDKSLRLNYSGDPKLVRGGLEIIAQLYREWSL